MAHEASKSLNWVEVDVSSMSKTLKSAYGELKSAQGLAKEKKNVLETTFISEARSAGKVASDETLKFSYRFGKLSVAVDEIETEKAPKVAKNAFRF